MVLTVRPSEQNISSRLYLDDDAGAAFNPKMIFVNLGPPTHWRLIVCLLLPLLVNRCKDTSDPRYFGPKTVRHYIFGTEMSYFFVSVRKLFFLSNRFAFVKMATEKKTKNRNWTRKKFTACRSWALCGINAWEISYLHRARQFQSATLTYCGNLYSAPPPLQLNTLQSAFCKSSALAVFRCSCGLRHLFTTWQGHNSEELIRFVYLWTEKNPRFMKIRCFPEDFLVAGSRQDEKIGYARVV